MSRARIWRIVAVLVALAMAIGWLTLEREETAPDSGDESGEGAAANLSGRVDSHPVRLAPPLEPRTPEDTGPTWQRREDPAALKDQGLIILAGTVADSDTRAPVPGARIQAQTLEGYSETAITDPSGSFRLGLPPRATFSLHAGADGYRPQTRSDLYAEGHQSLLISLERELVLQGRVVDPAGNPVKGAEIQFSCLGGSVSFSTPSPWTGADGAFEIRFGSGLTVGETGRRECRLQASHPAADLPATVAVEVPIDDEVILVLGTVDQGAAGVWGRVSDPEGRPLPRAAVKLFKETSFGEAATSQADSEGIYRFTAVTPGKYTLAASSGPEPGNRQPVTLAPAQDLRVDLVVGIGKDVKGRILSPSGEPIPGARIDYGSEWRQPGGEGTFGSSTWSDEAGNFVLQDLKTAYFYRIVATHTDYQQFRAELGYPFPAFIEIVLQRGLTLRGVVNDQLGMPFSEGTLSIALPGEAAPLRSASLGGSGTFEFRGLPTGALELRLARAAGPTLTGDVVLSADRRIVVLVGGNLTIHPH